MEVKGNSPFKGGYDHHILRQACKHSVRYGHPTTNRGATKSFTLNQSIKIARAGTPVNGPACAKICSRSCFLLVADTPTITPLAGRWSKRGIKNPVEMTEKAQSKCRSGPWRADRRRITRRGSRCCQAIVIWGGKDYMLKRSPR